ncbi:flagellar biosynthetic protein FliR [Formivibrio citricus]|uniref:Flagellar biosynthetic protein FliR n=1 Tax=Formivibrio citricus TaxID=83765 RepID=A0A1I5ATM4_9NEIS|nr:flagellar biosynthetic protein FliR [Formivibrio citricus]SFN65549.1 flagellar biosynthetic protein FliR [Formivibrio citricus]
MLSFTQGQVDAWLALFWWPYLRIFGLMIVDPFFSSRSIPVRVRVGLSILLVLLVAPNLQPLPHIPVVSPQGILIALKELLIGASLGFTVRLIFTGMEMAGHLSGLQMGLGFATFYDPQHATSTPVVAQLLSLFMLLVFLAFDGHLVVLRALLESYAQLPIGPAPPGAGGLKLMADFGAFVFRSGVMLSLPVLAALLVTNLAIGVMTRAAPQLNVFAIGFPLTLAIGAGALYLSLPYLVPYINGFLGEITRHFLKLLRAFGG